MRNIRNFINHNSSIHSDEVSIERLKNMYHYKKKTHSTFHLSRTRNQTRLYSQQTQLVVGRCGRSVYRRDGAVLDGCVCSTSAWAIYRNRTQIIKWVQSCIGVYDTHTRCRHTSSKRATTKRLETTQLKCNSKITARAHMVHWRICAIKATQANYNLIQTKWHKTNCQYTSILYTQSSHLLASHQDRSID